MSCYDVSCFVCAIVIFLVVFIIVVIVCDCVSVVVWMLFVSLCPVLFSRLLSLLMLSICVDCSYY